MAGYGDDPTNRLANVIIDLKGTSRTHIKINYASQYPGLRAMLTPVGGAPFEGTTNGQLVFKINAPVTATRVVGFDVSVIVMARPAQAVVFGVRT